MRASRAACLLLAVLIAAVLPMGCRRQRSGTFVIALGDNIRTIDLSDRHQSTPPANGCAL